MSKAIELKDVGKVYRTGDEDTVALAGVNIDIEAGEFVAVMGPSGSGKSSLMHIIGLLDKPTSGAYLLEGQDVSRLSSRRQAQIRNQEIGFVFQQFNLLARTTVLDNVLLPTIYGHNGHGSRRRALELIGEVGLTDRIKHRSNQLSGGQIQRVAIARALVMDPAIILADEPTGNLDSTRSKEIMELFQKINGRGVTIVLITHEEQIAAHAGRTIRLMDGRVTADSASAPAAEPRPEDAGSAAPATEEEALLP